MTFVFRSETSDLGDFALTPLPAGTDVSDASWFREVDDDGDVIVCVIVCPDCGEDTYTVPLGRRWSPWRAVCKHCGHSQDIGLGGDL